MLSTDKQTIKLERAADAVQHWLDVQNLDDLDSSDVEMDDEDLHEISTLALADAPEADLAGAVHRARDAGWNWSPIAAVLGVPRAAAIERFS
ncbi:MAG TPA: hypothetical protein VGH99_01245 [Pseudonocardia sp.]|jgi:hypothetical protein